MILSLHKSLIRTPWLWIPRPLNFAAPGGYPCCCRAKCPACSGRTPRTMRMVIAGLTNDDCSDCSSLNVAYDCSFLSAAAASCQWHYSFPSAICGKTDAFVRVGMGGTVTGELSTGGFNYINWAGSTGDLGQIDCMLDTFALSFYAQVIHNCDASVSTCTITAIA